MSATAEVQSGLEGVVAFATEIAEPDREGGALRYRGVDIEELVGTVPFETPSPTHTGTSGAIPRTRPTSVAAAAPTDVRAPVTPITAAA